MKSFIGDIRSPTGAPLGGVTVTVTDHYSGSAIAIYQEDGTTTLAAVVSDINGRYRFKADGGLFDLAFAGPSFTGSEMSVPHTDGGPLLVLTCGEGGGIGFGKVCYVSAANAAKLAKNNGTESEAAASLICVTRGGRTNGQTGVFTGPCSFGGFSGLTAAGTVYLGTAGGVTTTEPATAVVLGQALSTTRIDFRPAGAAGGGGVVESIVAGDGIGVDATDPANPVISLSPPPAVYTDTRLITRALLQALSGALPFPTNTINLGPLPVDVVVLKVFLSKAAVWTASGDPSADLSLSLGTIGATYTDLVANHSQSTLGNPGAGAGFNGIHEDVNQPGRSNGPPDVIAKMNVIGSIFSTFADFDTGTDDIKVTLLLATYPAL